MKIRIIIPTLPPEKDNFLLHFMVDIDTITTKLIVDWEIGAIKQIKNTKKERVITTLLFLTKGHENNIF